MIDVIYTLGIMFWVATVILMCRIVYKLYVIYKNRPRL